MCLKHSDYNVKEFSVLFKVKVIRSIRCLDIKFQSTAKILEVCNTVFCIATATGEHKMFYSLLKLHRIYNNSSLD